MGRESLIGVLTNIILANIQEAKSMDMEHFEKMILCMRDKKKKKK